MSLRRKISLCAALVASPALAHAAPGAGAPAMGWHVSLSNGFDYICARMEAQGDKTRLYLHANTDDSLDIPTADVVGVEQVELPPDAASSGEPRNVGNVAATKAGKHAALDVGRLAADSARLANLDKDIILSIIQAESAGNAQAVSRVGARGLMQLMPATASNIGVNPGNPAGNVDGGTAYFEYLLERYHDDLVKALAAYNAGPGAVDKYHGVPPYRETRAYVRRVINEFNRRKLLAARANNATQARLQVSGLDAR